MINLILFTEQGAVPIEHRARTRYDLARDCYFPDGIINYGGKQYSVRQVSAEPKNQKSWLSRLAARRFNKSRAPKHLQTQNYELGYDPDQK